MLRGRRNAYHSGSPYGSTSPTGCGSRRATFDGDPNGLQVATGLRSVPVTRTPEASEVPPEMIGRFHAFKLHVHEPERVAPLVEKSRAAVGPDCPLMIDAWMEWDVATTLAVAERVRPFGVAWVEEPLPPDDLRGYAELAGRCPIAIAGGEHEFSAAAFAELIERRLHQVFQPDVCWCGGLTELVKIYNMAKRAGLPTRARICGAP